jgi:hypothetical protein
LDRFSGGRSKRSASRLASDEKDIVGRAKAKAKGIISLIYIKIMNSELKCAIH